MDSDRATEPDIAALLALEARAHRWPGRTIREVSGGILVHDPRDPEPVFNRLVDPILPEDAAAWERFPAVTGVGVEFEPDSVARARATIEASHLSDRIVIEQADIATPGHTGEFDLAYFQYALHGIPDPVGALRAAWTALRPGGRLLVLDWPLPTDPEEAHTVYGALIAGVHLDELLQSGGLATRAQVSEWFGSAGLAEPEVMELPSGATAWLATKGG